MTDDQKSAIEEFQHAVREYLAAKEGEVAGRRYALMMAATELQLLGLDPSMVTPDGYEVKP